MPQSHHKNVFGPCEMTEGQAGFIAGLLDGEGSITIFQRDGKDQRMTRGLCPKLTIANTKIELLEACVRMTGNGAIKVSDNGEGRKPIYVWQLQPSQMRLVLPWLLPYLVIKRKQAELLLKLFAIQTARKDEGRYTYTDEQFAEMVEIYREVRTLNHRGSGEPDIKEIEIRDFRPNPSTTKCMEEGCDAPRTARGRGLCFEHWKALQPLKSVTCEECGKAVETQFNPRFCSPACRQKAGDRRRSGREPNRIVPCLQCGVEFETTGYKQFCSEPCRNRWKYLQMKAAGTVPVQKSKKRTEPLVLKCKECGADFEAKKSDAMFCGQKCRSADFSKRRAAEMAARESFPCVECGGPVDRTRYADKQFCSERCQARHWKRAKREANRQEPESRVCKQCGESFVPTKATQVFCTYACNRAFFKNPARKVTCGGCGKEFETTDSRRVTCSQKCYWQMDNERRKARKQSSM